jgi:hypothetical protein
LYDSGVCKIPSLVFLILAAAGSVVVAAAETPPSQPCKLATGGDNLASPVDQACKEGGVGAAKIKMKEMLREGRRAGVKNECDDCHTTDEDYSKLAKGAEERFKKLLAALPKKP